MCAATKITSASPPVPPQVKPIKMDTEYLQWILGICAVGSKEVSIRRRLSAQQDSISPRFNAFEKANLASIDVAKTNVQDAYAKITNLDIYLALSHVTYLYPFLGGFSLNNSFRNALFRLLFTPLIFSQSDLLLRFLAERPSIGHLSPMQCGLSGCEHTPSPFSSVTSLPHLLWSCTLGVY